MMYNLFIAAFIMLVGLCFAGMGVHLYQLIWRVPAVIGYSGKTYLASLGHLSVSFICGPYIMLTMGWRKEANQKPSLVAVLISALVAFSWAFITGLFIISLYLALKGLG